MALKIVFGPEAKDGFLNDVYEVDKSVYDPSLCGKVENLYSRYEVNKDTFILLYDDDFLAGYMNFFPICDTFYKQLMDVNDPSMRDDDIRPDELTPWQTNKANNIFVLSLALRPEYQKSGAVITITDAFLSFIREKDAQGIKINSITGNTVSTGGTRFFKRLNGLKVKTLNHGYTCYSANKYDVADVIKNGYRLNKYKLTYKNDMYFFVPMTTHEGDNLLPLLEKADKTSSDPEAFGNIFRELLSNHIEYECNNPIFKKQNIKRFYLGEFHFACYDDEYDGVPLALETAHLFVTAHHKTGICIATVALPNNTYIPTQLIDQMSTENLFIAPKVDGQLTVVPESFMSVQDYLCKDFNLEICGESKCVVCMSNEPEDRTELGYLLAGETYISQHIEYKIRPERIEPLLKNRACYNYYDSYISKSVIAFVFKDYTDDMITRLECEASELFIVQIVLFQNTAVLRTNYKVINYLQEQKEISNEEIEELYIEFAKTMPFWDTKVFKYPISQLEADEVVISFGIDEILDDYHRNHQFLDRLIELKNSIASEKSSNMTSTFLYFLTCIDCCSITLAGVLWLLTKLVDSASPYYSILDIMARIAWVGVFAIIAFTVKKYISIKANQKTKRKIKRK